MLTPERERDGVNVDLETIIFKPSQRFDHCGSVERVKSVEGPHTLNGSSETATWEIARRYKAFEKCHLRNQPTPSFLRTIFLQGQRSVAPQRKHNVRKNRRASHPLLRPLHLIVKVFRRGALMVAQHRHGAIAPVIRQYLPGQGFLGWKKKRGKHAPSIPSVSRAAERVTHDR